ncbi:MAG: ATP-dependent DNA helicase RecG [Anaerovoracaceae bacterium]
MNLRDSIKEIKGVGPKKAQALQRVGIETIEDFLYYYPREYQDRREIKKIAALEHGSLSLVQGTVKLKVKGGYGKKMALKLYVTDETGGMEVVFFNARFLINQFETGNTYTFYGRAEKKNGKTRLLHPEFHKGGGDPQGIVPVYPLTYGISQNEMNKWQKMVCELCDEAEEALTDEILERNKLCGIGYALKNIHFPKEKGPLKAARYRLIFDEFLYLQLGLMALKNRIGEEDAGILFNGKDGKMCEFAEKLPYLLTNAQKRVAEEIERDMESDKVMNRLVQGDVGSGKTAIAEMALYKAVKNGYQGVMMAPTEILAKQHFDSLSRDFKSHDISVGFLSGSMSLKEKRAALEALKNGETDILVGTHALIQPTVEFKNLGLVITDEQHRFGVNQRAVLADKGINPDVLVMTATPIPRTLAVIMYGDLDISVIDELPPGRQQIKTRAYTASGRGRVYSFVREEIKKGRQAYVVAPLIEASESLEDVVSAQELYEKLSMEFSDMTVELLHGEMKQSDKDMIMERFARGEIDILVSTVVIEVGINVPNASVMVVENAERFGLAQLHQLRGRVGRGKNQSYCLLVSCGKTPVSKERIEIMTSTSDGFIIAEKDLELRGPGEFFGMRQHGIPDLKLANLVKHIDVFNAAKQEAKIILDKDPKLQSEQFAEIRRRILKLFDENSALSL